MRRSTHAGKLERWLGPEHMAAMEDASRQLFCPVPVANVPGQVFAYKGDFIGQIKAGGYASLIDITSRPLRRALYPKKRGVTLHAGFSGLSDIISEMTAGAKLQSPMGFQRTGVTGVANVANTLWFEGNYPVAGALGGALTSGGSAAITQCSSATTGAVVQQADATGGDYLYVVDIEASGTVAANTLMLYDRIAHGATAMNSTSAQTITGGLNRYATAGTSVGNFCFVEIQSALAATAHNHTIEYTDNAGNVNQVSAAFAGINAGIAKRVDHAGFAIPLLAGDYGLQSLSKYTCSAAVATGANNIVVGHPILLIPLPTANKMESLSAFIDPTIMQRIYDGACLALLEINKPSVTATSYQGFLSVVSG
jgi:hypothetical protein